MTTTDQSALLEGPCATKEFSDGIDLMDGRNGELQDLTNRLVDRATAYGMEVSTEKSKIMTSSMNFTKQMLA